MITFKAGTRAIAEEVNSNFSEVQNGINTLQKTIETNANNIANLQTKTSELDNNKADTDLSNLSNAGESRGGGMRFRQVE